MSRAKRTISTSRSTFEDGGRLPMLGSFSDQKLNVSVKESYKHLPKFNKNRSSLSLLTTAHDQMKMREGENSRLIHRFRIIKKEMDFNRRVRIADNRLELKKQEANKKRFEKAYERLDRQTKVSKTLMEWDRANPIKPQRKLNHVLPDLSGDGSRSGVTAQIANNNYTSAITIDNQMKLPANKKDQMTGNKLSRRALSMIPTKKSGSLSLQTVSSRQQPNQEKVTSMPSHHKMPHPRSRNHATPKGRNEVGHKMASSPSSFLANSNSFYKNSDKQSASTLPTETQSLLAQTQHTSIAPTLIQTRSMSLDLTADDIRRVQLQNRRLIAQKQYQESRNAEVSSSVLGMKLTRESSAHNKHLVSLKDYQEFDSDARKDQALNPAKFGCDDAWRHLHTRYLRLTNKNIDMLEGICTEAGLDTTSHPHST